MEWERGAIIFLKNIDNFIIFVNMILTDSEASLK